MNKSRSLQPADAMRSRRFVRIARRFDDERIRGYVSGVGPRWFLVTLVSDRLWFDGFECFRVADIKKLDSDPYATFAEAALKKRKERKPKHSRIRLGSIEEVLLSAGRAFPLVAIHREVKNPDVCQIGRVLGVRKGSVELLEINPGAIWDTTPTRYKLSEITRVNFGGDYEGALHLVGSGKNG